MPLILAALFSALRHSLVNDAAALILVAFIVAFATFGTRVTGLLASLSSTLWFDFFLTVPYRAYAIRDASKIQTTVALFVVGVLVTEVAARSHHHRLVSSLEADYVAAFDELASSVSGDTSRSTVLDNTSATLTTLLSLRSCRIEMGDVAPPLARINADGEVTHVGFRWPVEDIGIPGPEAEIPLTWHGRVRGRFVLVPTPGRPVSRERRVVAVALATLAGALFAGPNEER